MLAILIISHYINLEMVRDALALLPIVQMGAWLLCADDAPQTPSDMPVDPSNTGMEESELEHDTAPAAAPAAAPAEAPAGRHRLI